MIAAATTVGAQMWYAFPANARIRADSVADLVELTLSKFFGYYLLSPAGRLPALALGCILFAYVGYTFLRQLRVVDSADERLRCLLYILPALAIAASVARAPLAEIDPNDWGPRYFFLPFTFLSWILWNAPVDSPRMKRIGPMIVALSVVNSASHFFRLQASVDWAGAAREQQLVGTARLPLQMSGEVEDVLFIYTDEGGKWKVEIFFDNQSSVPDWFSDGWRCGSCGRLDIESEAEDLSGVAASPRSR